VKSADSDVDSTVGMRRPVRRHQVLVNGCDIIVEEDENLALTECGTAVPGEASTTTLPGHDTDAVAKP